MKLKFEKTSERTYLELETIPAGSEALITMLFSALLGLLGFK